MQDWPTPTINPFSRPTPAQMAWFVFRLILFVGVATLIIISVARAEEDFTRPFIDEQCMDSYSCRFDSETTKVVWDLMLMDEVISQPFSGMTSSECEALKAALVLPVYCRPRLVEREKS
jgi:hypothetical protein